MILESGVQNIIFRDRWSFLRVAAVASGEALFGSTTWRTADHDVSRAVAAADSALTDSRREAVT